MVLYRTIGDPYMKHSIYGTISGSK